MGWLKRTDMAAFEHRVQLSAQLPPGDAERQIADAFWDPVQFKWSETSLPPSPVHPGSYYTREGIAKLADGKSLQVKVRGFVMANSSLHVNTVELVIWPDLAGANPSALLNRESLMKFGFSRFFLDKFDNRFDLDGGPPVAPDWAAYFADRDKGLLLEWSQSL